ncbi:antitoxin [Microbacterium yannicii]|uniref:antitoxin n=1 Tax=Microbacterium yannicii TaxID=671622 RepID=UPI0002E83B28|nr:antitoxin [Microbacterium yannicii]
MADFGGLADKAKDAANSEKGEQVSDAAIDKAGDATDSATGGKFGDKINAGEEAADDKVGDR